MADNPLIAALRAGSGPGLAAASGPAEVRFPWMATQGAPLKLRSRAPAVMPSDASRGPGTPGVLPTPGPVVPGPVTTPADPPPQDDSWIGTVPGISWPPSVAPQPTPSSPPVYQRPVPGKPEPGAQQQPSTPADLGPGVPVDQGFENLPIGLAWTVSPEAAGFQPPPVVDAPAAPAPQPPAEITPEAESALQDYYAQLYGGGPSYGPAADIPVAPAPAPESTVEPTWSMMPSDVAAPDTAAPALVQPEVPVDAGLMFLPLEVPADEPAPAPAPRPPRRTLPSYKDIVPDWSLDWMQP